MNLRRRVSRICLTKIYLTGLMITLVTAFFGNLASASNQQSLAVEWELQLQDEFVVLDIAETEKGYMIAGTQDQGLLSLLRTNLHGQLVESHPIEITTSSGHEVLVTVASFLSDKGLLLAGTAPVTAGSETYFYVAQMDRSGRILWEKEQLFQGYVEANYVSGTSDGGAIYAYNPSSALSYVVKVDENGTEQWKSEIAMTKYDPHAVVETIKELPDGGYIAGAFRSGSFLLWRLDNNGQTIWQNYVGDGIGWVVPAAENGFAVVNYRSSIQQSTLIFTDQNAQQRLSHSLGVAGTARSIERTLDGGYVVGISNAVVRVDPAGQISWTYPVSQLTRALSTHDNGILYVISYNKIIKLGIRS